MSNEASLQLTMPAARGEDTLQARAVQCIMFNIVTTHIQPDSNFSRTEAAECLGALTPESRPLSLFQKNQHVEDWLHQVFDFIWDIAKQIPYQHRGQDRLMELLRTLPYLPCFQTVLNSSGEQVPAWTEVAHWDGRSELHRALDPPDKNSEPDERTCEEYVNASAFAARFFKTALEPKLYVHGPTRRLGRRLAVSAVETAVGGTIPNPELLPCHYIAAAQWIVVAADWLWTEIRWGQVQHYEVTETACDNPAFPPARWVR